LEVERHFQGSEKAYTAERVAKPCGWDFWSTGHTYSRRRFVRRAKRRALGSAYAVGPQSSSEVPSSWPLGRRGTKGEGGKFGRKTLWWRQSAREVRPGSWRMSRRTLELKTLRSAGDRPTKGEEVSHTLPRLHGEQRHLWSTWKPRERMFSAGNRPGTNPKEPTPRRAT
jgi:hypothetical protein